MKALLLLVFAVPASCLAFDLTLPDGKAFKDIRLISKTDIGISIQHEGGIAAVDYGKMSPHDARMFGYVPAKYEGAKAMEKLQAEPRPEIPADPNRPPAETAKKVPTPSRQKGEPPKGEAAGEGRCQAITKKGDQCSRKATTGGYCWQHQR